MQIQVECYAGYRGEQEPRRFRLQRSQVEVKEIIDRWMNPSHRYFKVKGEDDAIYLLRHDEARQAWELTMFDCNRHGPTRLSSG